MNQSSPMLAALFLAPGLCFAQAPVLVVDDTPGPGVDYNDLPTAIAAAPEGALLLVRDGTYASFTLTKGLSIEGYYGETPKINSPVVIRDLPQNSTAMLRHLSIPHQGSYQVSSDQRPVTLENNQGRVWLEEIQIGASGSGFGRTGLLATDCDSVVLVASQIDGGSGGGIAIFNLFAQPYMYDVYLPFGGGRGVATLRSNLTAVDCFFRGGPGNFAGFLGVEQYGATTGGIGMRIERGELFLSGTTIQGGPGGGDITCQVGGPKDGGAGLSVIGSGSKVHQLDSLFIGGLGSIAIGWSCSGDFSNGAPIVAPIGSVVNLPGKFLSLDAPSPIASSTTATLLLSGGTPGGAAFLGIGLGSTDLPLPPLGGVLLVADPILILPLGNLPASGPLAVDIPLGALPASIQSIAYFAQGAYFESNGTLVLGAASGGFLVDSSL